MTGGTKGEGICRAGRLAGKRVILAVSGIGKVNAAHAATRLIHEFSPAVIMNIGIGGAYPSSGLNIGDVAIAEKEIYGDDGVLLKDGFHGLDFIGLPLLKKGRKEYFNKFPLDGKLVNKVVELITHHSSLITVKKGTFLTLSSCTGTKKRAVELERRFGAICENMEGAAIAHICALYGIPLIEMRGISNIVEDRDRSAWNITLAAENCQKAALECIRVI
jgi:futalosine hydrolase